MDVAVSYTQMTYIKKLFLPVADSRTRSVCESPLPELSHDLIRKVKSKCIQSSYGSALTHFGVGCRWKSAKHNFTADRENRSSRFSVTPSGEDMYVQEEVSFSAQRVFFSSGSLGQHVHRLRRRKTA